MLEKNISPQKCWKKLLKKSGKMLKIAGKRVFQQFFLLKKTLQCVSFLKGGAKLMIRSIPIGTGTDPNVSLVLNRPLLER